MTTGDDRPMAMTGEKPDIFALFDVVKAAPKVDRPVIFLSKVKLTRDLPELMRRR